MKQCPYQSVRVKEARRQAKSSPGTPNTESKLLDGVRAMSSILVPWKQHNQGSWPTGNRVSTLPGERGTVARLVS
jgi:hypothetical protein